MPIYAKRFELGIELGNDLLSNFLSILFSIAQRPVVTVKNTCHYLPWQLAFLLKIRKDLFTEEEDLKNLCCIGLDTVLKDY